MNSARYQRLDEIEGWDSERVRAGRIVVLGCGALGNEVAKNLALVGWGTIILVDFDQIEESNLTRSVFFRPADCGQPKATVLSRALMDLNPDCHAIGLVGDISEMVSLGMVARSHMVIGCVDNVQARLVANRLAGTAGRPFIDGGLGAWQGTASAYADPTKACYACGLDRQDIQELSLRRSCPSFAARIAQRGGVPTTPTISSTVAAEMVNLALKWLHGQRALPDFPVSQQLRWDQRFNRFWKADLPRNPNCYGHPSPVTPRIEPLLEWNQTWNEIFQISRRSFGDDLTIQLPGEVRVCGENGIGERVVQVVGDELWLRRTPQSMGLPCWSWLTLDGVGREVCIVELQGTPDELNHWQL